MAKWKKQSAVFITKSGRRQSGTLVTKTAGTRPPKSRATKRKRRRR